MPPRRSRTPTGWRPPGAYHGDPRTAVIAVVGDGSLTGGVAYEALNNIGISGTDVVIVLNDNGRSYAPTVSRISSAGRLPSTGRLCGP